MLTVAVSPGPIGGHNWQPMAFNPRTGLVYIPAQDPFFAFARFYDRYAALVYPIILRIVRDGLEHHPEVVKMLVERVWRDLRLNRIGAGTDEIMLDVIGRSYGI